MTEETTAAQGTREDGEAEGGEAPPVTVLADRDPAAVRPAEFPAMAAEMGKAYRRQVEFYKNEYEKALPEALELAAAASTDQLQAAFLEGLRTQPPDQVSWGYLRHLEDGRPGDALRKWEEVKAFARDETGSGMRGASAVEHQTEMGSGPLGRARYIVLVEEMAKDWAPLTGIEFILVQQMAQAYTMQLYWTEIFSYRGVYNVGKVDHGRGEWESPQVSRQEALTEAAGMVDRWNRMFLRCLRQLRDLRRYSPVVINNPKQVNLANQQVNVSGDTAARGSKGRRAKRRKLT